MYKFVDKEYEILNAPLTRNQVKGMMEENGRIEVVIEFDLNQLVNAEGFDEINDIADGMVLGVYACLSDISYEIVGCSENNTVLILVSAEVEDDFFEDEDDDDDDDE